MVFPWSLAYNPKGGFSLPSEELRGQELWRENDVTVGVSNVISGGRKFGLNSDLQDESYWKQISLPDRSLHCFMVTYKTCHAALSILLQKGNTN